jgi:hypothetical protein
MANQAIWLKSEIRIADELLSLASNLTDDYLKYHSDFKTTFSKGVSYENDYIKDPLNKKAAWKVDALRYTYPNQEIDLRLFEEIHMQEKFPTAAALTKKYSEHCLISSYSVLESQSSIGRHTDMENRDRTYVRIHIPLIVPEGDIFLEVDNIEIDWSDIFAFDSELPHSAYNFSNHRRLVYILDISRKFLGIPPGDPWSQELEQQALPFVRGTKSKLLHKK